MKSSNKNIDKKIKSKIEKYEFEFSDHAWNKMEGILDPPSKPRRNYFLMLLSLITMISSFFVFYLLVYGTFGATDTLSQTEPATPMAPNTAIIHPSVDNDPAKIVLADTLIDNQNNTITQSNNLTPKTSTPNPGITDPLNPLTMLLPDPIVPPSLLPEPSPPVVKKTNPAFIADLKNTLAEHEAHFATEKVYLQFDRTFFGPGDQIWYNAYLRDANSLRESQKSDVLYVELRGPNGNVIKTHKMVAPKGASRGNFQLSEAAVGGRYTVKAYTNWQKNQDLFFEKKIQVQKPVLPKLKMTLDLTRESYGPGDEVQADLELRALDNQPLSNKSFTCKLSIDGKEKKNLTGKTDENGKAKITVDLPNKLKTTDGLVNVIIDYQGQTESIARSVPIILNQIDLQFLPEGGYLLSGFENGLGFKALNEFGKPADLTGIIYNKNKEEVAEFSTYHQGTGAINFKPQKGESYYARILQPEGINQEYAIPNSADNGYGLRIIENTETNLTVDIHNTENEPLTLVLQSRGEIFDHVMTNPVKGTQRVRLSTVKARIGIAQLTLFDGQEIPRAERMVFLHPDKKLNIDITTDKPDYQPRDAVKMKITVKDERGIPLAGKFSLAVADDNLLTFADDKQGNILGEILLDSELKGSIEEPNFYFDPPEDHPEKDQALALDHLMMTQGWRRFDWSEARGQALAAMEFEAEDLIVRGRIVNRKGDPMSKVKVKVKNTDKIAITDDNGMFKFEEEMIPVRSQEISLERDRYRTIRYVNLTQDTINLVFEESVRKQVEMSRTPFNGTQVSGKVWDDDTKETLIGANIIFKKEGLTVAGASTDFYGNFKLNIDPGTYEFTVKYLGFDDYYGSMIVKANYNNIIDVHLHTGGQLLDEIIVKSYKVPLMSRDNTTSGATITSQEIKNLPTKDISALASTTAGLSQKDEGDEVTIRGSRAGAVDYYIDGARVTGALVPESEAEQKAASLTGTPANAPPPAFEEMNDEAEILAAPVIVEADQRMERRKTQKPGRSRSGRVTKRERSQANLYYQPTEFYAPAYTKKEAVVPANQRTDFRPTIYWNPQIETGMDGTATVEFFTSDALTSFRATVEGFGQEGSLGRGKKVFSNEIPMGIDVKLPARVLMGDEIKIPVILSNKTNQSVTGKLVVELPEELELIEKFSEQVVLSPKKGNTIFVFVKAVKSHPEVNIKIGFSGGGFKDNMEGKMEILSRGFPVERGYTSQDASHTFTLHVKDPVSGSVNLGLTAQSSLDQQIMADLKRMVRQPRGCFEQTSSSNYPNLLVLDYLRATGNLDSDTEKKLVGFLASGYKRLIGYEVKGGGFDWFGKPPGHEALTAYGLLQFVDMKRVYAVDTKMIDRNAKWLLGRRDGAGGWKLSKRGLHSWKSNDPVYDAYIVWALVEAGMGKKIGKEIEKSTADALTKQDPYLLALMANALATMKDKRAGKLLDILLEKQSDDGKWENVANTVVNSRGISKDVETTGLAALAMIKYRPESPQLITAMDFLRNAKSKYGYGSTQATVLALKAMTAYATKIDDGRRSGTLAVHVNGKKVGEQDYGNGKEGNIVLEDLGQYLRAGKNKVKVSFKNKASVIPYYLSLNYNTLLPDNHPDCALKLSTKLASKKAKMGDQLRLTATLENREGEAVTNPIIKIGIPAGLTVQAWQLKEMEEQKVFDYYELFDGYLVLYFRELAPDVSKKINLDLKADIPGSYEAAASSAWLYYANEAVTWSKPGRVEI